MYTAYAEQLEMDVPPTLTFCFGKAVGSELGKCFIRAHTSITNIHLPRADTSYGQRSISYEGVNLWNYLPEDLKSISPINKFKEHLKLHLQVESYNN